MFWKKKKQQNKKKTTHEAYDEEEKESITYESVAIPEIHIRKKKK